MLHLRDIDFRYTANDPWVMQGLTLDIERGEIFGLLGPNGAGKTTLISLIVGLSKPSRGEIVRDFTRRPSLVPQHLAIYPMLSGRENLRFFGGILGLSGNPLKRRMDYCIEFAGLDAVIGRRAGDYSGGLKRRLNLAIGLLAEPELLLLDEPSVGIDPQSRAFILDAIRKLGRSGTTVIYTSHYMDEIESLCTRVAILDHGRVLVQGPLSAILAGDPHMHLRFDRAAPPALLELLARDYAAFDIQSRAVTLRLPLAQPLSVLAQTCEHHGVNLERVQRGAKNLEDVFMNLTHRSLRD
jgi:ABC-2 type transport system ATP-binding protein